VATLFPSQGNWDEGDYFGLTNRTKRPIELTDGRIDLLSWPTMTHQRLLWYLVKQLDAFVSERRLGEPMFIGIRVRLRENKYRMPDVMFMSNAHADRVHNDYWDVPDLVMEVVGEDNPERDHVVKVDDYADAGVAEYWIVDPRERSMVVLRLEGGRYITHGEAGMTGTIESALLLGFIVEADAVWAAAEGPY
jgi:Uma2 family endonuclease